MHPLQRGGGDASTGGGGGDNDALMELAVWRPKGISKPRGVYLLFHGGGEVQPRPRLESNRFQFLIV